MIKSRIFWQTILSLLVFVGICKNTYAGTFFDSSDEAQECNNLFIQEKYSSAVPHCRKACNMRDGIGCYYLAMLFSRGKEVKRDLRLSNLYLEQACSSEYYTYSDSPLYHGSSKVFRGDGCKFLGLNYALGIGVRQDNLKAKVYFEESCNLDNGEGCLDLALHYNENQDYKNSGKYFKKSCDLNCSDGCLSLSILYINPKGTSHDFIKGKEYAGKACDLGSQEGCNVYRELNEKGY